MLSCHFTCLLPFCSGEIKKVLGAIKAKHFAIGGGLKAAKQPQNQSFDLVMCTCIKR